MRDLVLSTYIVYIIKKKYTAQALRRDSMPSNRRAGMLWLCG